MKKHYLIWPVALCVILAACVKQDPVNPKDDPQEQKDDPEKKPDPAPGDGHFSGGRGTAEEPYIIATATDLDSLAKYTNNGKMLSASFKQTKDIDMTPKTGYKPIAQSKDKPFTGTYDGGGCKVSNLRIKNSLQLASGMFAYTSGATIKSVVLDKLIMESAYIYSGAIAGFAKNSTISECSMTGQMKAYEKSLSLSGDANVGYSGGLIGEADDCKVSSCTVDGDVTIYGKYSGGVIGQAVNCEVTDCRVLMGRTINIYYHYAGGIIGRAQGAKTHIKGCSFEGNLTSVGYIQGGIVSHIDGGTVEDCVLGSYGSIGSDKYYVGGIVGEVIPTSEASVRNCACYGTVKGQYSVGGIVGYAKPSAGCTIESCATIGATITGTGNNGGSNSYSLVAGILGWGHGTGKLTIKGCCFIPGMVQTISVGNRGGLGGVSGYQNGTGTVLYDNCYSSVTASTMLNRNDMVTKVSGDCFYGAIFARVTQTATIKDCFYDKSLQIGPSGAQVASGCTGYETAQLADGTLLAKLNATSLGTVWVAGANGLPTIQGLPADPNVKPKAGKRVSVIGDSISTFKGWIPAGYSAHYPSTDGALTLVSETYWYRLIHDHMKSAELDMNIAFSGSTVTNTTDANYSARYGTATNAWFKKDFVTRFIECGGCGNPDIILIHGGTNDWAHNADPLYPGSPKSKDASTPSDAVLNAIYAKADAAKTRAEINALPDGTFCEAYTKLLCQIGERYPKCKVVCIIGDYLSPAFEQSMLKMAAHYGAKAVDLYAVNGFNDQKYMPKHDYNGTSGCHPGSQAMAFIADKIYKELGAWLEE